MPTKIIFDEAKECPGDFSDRYLSTIRSAKYWHHVLNFGDNIPTIQTNIKTIQFNLQIERDKALKNESQRLQQTPFPLYWQPIPNTVCPSKQKIKQYPKQNYNQNK